MNMLMGVKAMLKEITIGQYYPTNSIVHKLDPRLKLLTLISYIVFIFLAKSFLSLLYVVALTLAIILLTKIPIKTYLKNIKTILPIIIITSILNVLYVNEGATIFKWWVINITTGGISKAIFMAIRIIVLIIASAMLTYTTTPTTLTSAIESLLLPLKHIGLGNAVHTVAMMMTIALRFIPTLIDETEKLMNAQKARGADFDSGSLLSRVKALIPILIPLLISSIRRAFDLSEAMESRCYTGSHTRTRMNVLKLTNNDYVAIPLLTVAFGLVILFNYINLF